MRLFFQLGASSQSGYWARVVHEIREQMKIKLIERNLVV